MGEKHHDVVDATVVGKWYLRDETLIEPTLRISDDFSSDRIGLMAPNHFWDEVTSMFANTVGNGRFQRNKRF